MLNIGAYSFDPLKVLQILVLQKKRGSQNTPAKPPSDLHYNGSGICCIAHAGIDNNHHREWINRTCRNISIDHSTVFLPMEQIHRHRNGSVAPELALLSFDRMSRVLLII
jgi:hypothetical protein